MSSNVRLDAHFSRFRHWYAVHLLSFAVQDVFCLWLVERSGVERNLGVVIWVGGIVAALSLLLVWFCHEADTYDAHPQTRIWLYARAGLAIAIASMWIIPFAGALLSAVSVISLALSVLLIVVTVIDAASLAVRGILAP